MATRTDVYVRNDSGAMSLVAGAALDRIIEDARNDDEAFVRSHEAILLMLEGDDTFPARVVVDGELTQAEHDEWMARVTWPLELKDGVLLVAGGFDPRVFQGFRDGEDWTAGAVHAIEVPPGRWLVDVYTHRATISGRFLDEVWPSPLGAWFRASYPGEAFPRWIGAELALSPELDPGHEDAWRDPKAAVAGGALRLEDDTRAAVGYLVHLRPFDARARTSETPEGGWFGSDTGLRVPAVCPRGLLTNVAQVEERFGEAPPPAALEAPAHVRELVEGRIAPIPKGPLQIPLARLDLAFAIAWLMDVRTHPEIRLQTTSKRPPSVEGWHEPESDDEDWWWYRVPLNGTPFGCWTRMKKLAEALERVGTTTLLELWCARPPLPGLDDEGERVPGAGTLRLRGGVLDDVWHVGAAAPAAGVDVWRRALAFAEAVDDGERLVLTSAAEVAAFAASMAALDFLLMKPLIEDGMVRRLADADPWALAMLSRRVFAERLGSVFPVQPDPEVEDDEDED